MLMIHTVKNEVLKFVTGEIKSCLSARKVSCEIKMYRFDKYNLQLTNSSKKTKKTGSIERGTV